MRHCVHILLTILLACAPGAAAAATGISIERAGLGLKPAGATPSLTGRLGLRADLPEAWAVSDGGNAVYGGVRDSLRLGTLATESFGGVSYALSDAWSASFESAALHETPLLPRRYSFFGQLHAASGLSLGLKYRLYEADIGLRSGLSDPGGMYGYALVPARLPGASFGPSYQLQLSYQYTPSTTFGLVLGRDLETYTQGFEVLGNGPRQFGFTGQHWLTPSWALSYDLLSSDPGALRLQGLRLGVRYRF